MNENEKDNNLFGTNNEDASFNDNVNNNINEDIHIISGAEPHHEAYYSETIKDKKKGNNGKGSFTRFIAGILIISIIGGASIGVGFAAASPYFGNVVKNGDGIPKPDPANIDSIAKNGAVIPINSQNSIPDIAANVGPSVVSISNTKTVTSWMGEFNQSGLGSGIIYKENNENIYIITNNHVVEGASTLVVTFLGNTKVPAQIVGADAVTDIAVVSVNKKDIPEAIRNDIKPAPIGNSDDLRVGDLAIAIGTPIAEAYNNTVTVGFISALNREISVTDKELTLIQTDAAINPGNSGGALVGPNGAVIGINTIKLTGEVEGMGFAIPMNDAIPIAEELMTTGKIARPSLGITGQDMVESLANLYEIPVGIYVYEVLPGSSAEAAGIKPKDIIIEFDGQKISTMQELKDMLHTKKIGDTVTAKIVRGSSKKQIQIKLQEIPTTPAVQKQQ
ncbi:MAG: S1C family serine protease [Cellulosilyticaceae bacterium]